MTKAIQIIEAVALDKKHIELKEPISPKVGDNFKIAILPLSNDRERLFENLRQAYLSMTEEERSFEIQMAEEGLAASPEILSEGGEPERWWE